MKKSLIITGLLLLAGCSLFDSEDLILRKRRDETGSWMGSGPKKERDHEELIPGDTTVYVSAVEFPKDYCWQKDSVGENRPFSLVLYRNFKKVLSVRGGGIVSSDPDMHWIIGGHLYAEYSTGTETIVSIDGKEKIRYEGREMIRGLLDREDGFYTLGQSRSGTGLTFRRNGEIIFSDEEGIVLGDMYNPCCRSGGLYELDDGVPVFCYHVPGQSILLKKESLYLVKNGIPSRVELDGSVANVLDARVLNGNMCLVYSYDGGGIALFDGGNTRMPVIGKSYVSSDLCLRWSGKSVLQNELFHKRMEQHSVHDVERQRRKYHARDGADLRLLLQRRRNSLCIYGYGRPLLQIHQHGRFFKGVQFREQILFYGEQLRLPLRGHLLYGTDACIQGLSACGLYQQQTRNHADQWIHNWRERDRQSSQLMTLDSSGKTVMVTFNVSSGRICSMFSGHSMRQREPLSR